MAVLKAGSVLSRGVVDALFFYCLFFRESGQRACAYAQKNEDQSRLSRIVTANSGVPIKTILNSSFLSKLVFISGVYADFSSFQ